MDTKPSQKLKLVEVTGYGGSYDQTLLSCVGQLSAPLTLRKLGFSNSFTIAAGCVATSTQVFNNGGSITVNGTLNITQPAVISMTDPVTVNTGGVLNFYGGGLSTPGGITVNGTLGVNGSETFTAPTYGTGATTNFYGTNFRLRVIAQPVGTTVRLDAIEVRVYHVAGGGGQGGGEI